VILCTSTRIFPPEDIPVVPEVTERVAGILCVGTPAEQGKLSSPHQSFFELCAYADYVLVEADGSKHLPIKAHDFYEPVIPKGANRTILVVGASGLGNEISKVVHRHPIFFQLTASDRSTPQAVALALEKENLGDIIFVNQCDQAGEMALTLATFIKKPCCVGSVKKGEIRCLF
jgi:probable selenium-dependent hydroxylase accessory protein YqeC